MSSTLIQSASLLKAVEVWCPTEDGQAIELSAGVYNGLEHFESASYQRQFEIGQGLPGWVLNAKIPVLFDDLNSPDFLRREAAADDGLTAGMGFPIFDGDRVTAVMLFLCDPGESAVGAFESWLPEESRDELALGSGYYAGLDRFRRMSQYLRFPYGAGLPGGVWQTGLPRLIDHLADSTEFLRASGAHADGLECGLAFPVLEGHDSLQAVMLILSSLRSPIARVFQIWMPTSDEAEFELSAVVAPGIESIQQMSAEQTFRAGQGMIGHVAESRQPAILKDFDRDDDPLAAAASEAGLSWAVAWPIISRGQVRAVCVMID